MKRRYVREQKTLCGPEYMEVDLFCVSPAEHKAGRRAKKQMASSLAMENCNERRRTRYLRQMIPTNFTRRARVENLTYDDEHLPACPEEAEKDAGNFVRRLNRKLKRLGKPKAKYILVTEWQEADPEKKIKEVRLHHHMILECDLPQEEIEACWRRGHDPAPLGVVQSGPLKLDADGAARIAEYMTKQPKHGARRRRWRQSLGLKKPETPPPNDSKYSAKKLNEMATVCLGDADEWERRYKNQRGRTYKFACAESWWNDVLGEWRVTARFWAANPNGIDGRKLE